MSSVRRFAYNARHRRTTTVILAAGLTPAWQQILSFDRFTPGEVNRAGRAVWCASGKVLNVGCALHYLGVPSKTLCLVGGDAGRQVTADFDRMQIPVRWITSQVPTRVCTTILDNSTHCTTELVENSGSIPDIELTAFDEAFHTEARAASVVVLTGSLPQGTPANYYRRLLEQTTAKAVLDIRGPELQEALSLRPYVVKPNREELARTVGCELHTEDDFVAAMSELRGRGAEWVVVSQGPAPLLALGPAGLLRITPPVVDLCNPVGCGDCLAAGIAAGIDRRLSMPDALRIGLQAAAENAREMLPARNLTRLA
jgi:1-phosphofructokinase family hexose kinase